MSMIDCAVCGASVSEGEAYFGESGQVCGACHASTEADDSERFREVADAPIGADGGFHQSTTHVDEDGRVVTRSVSVNAGLLGVIIKLIMSLIRKLTGKP